MVTIAELKERSILSHSDKLSDSKLFKQMEQIRTPIPALNIIMSGDPTGGFTAGSTMFAGPSKHFKTLFALILCKAYMDKYPDALMVLFDSEFGSPLAYFDSIGIDKDRVFHAPFMDIEELKFETIKQLEALNEGDKVIFCIDSLGNAPSKKEVEDAQNEKSKADMTRAKALKSFSRMMRMRLIVKNVPMIIVNHTYEEIGAMFAKTIVSGGTGAYYAADDIFIIGRQKEADGAKTLGYNFTLRVEKSRRTKENSKVDITVSFDEGIEKFENLKELLIECGAVEKDGNGFNFNGKKLQVKNLTENDWSNILFDDKVRKKIQEKYMLSDLLEQKNV